MGLGSFTTKSNTTYLRIGIGEDEKGRQRAIIGKRSKEGTPGAVQVFKAAGDPALDKDGNTVWRTEYAFIEGTVVAINRATKNYGGKDTEELEIEIVDNGELFTLQVEKGSDYWLDLALRMPNVDWTKPVRLQPYSIPQENKPEFSNRLLIPYVGDVMAERKWKIQWIKGDGAGVIVAPGDPPPFTYDDDEAKWKKRKTFNWLDEHAVEEAIGKVKFLHEQQPVSEEPLPHSDEMNDLPFN